MSSQTIRIGIVGAGGIVRTRHVPNLKGIEGVELRAVANRSRASGERFAEEFGVHAVEDDWRTLVARDDVDAVWIGAWPNLHRDATVAALGAGKHVFCQARMARDAAEAREMLTAAEASGRTTMLCPPPHAMKGDPAVRRLLRERAIGALRHVRVQSMSGAFADAAAPHHWRLDAGISGNNALDLGICAEIVQGWVGDARRVQAVGTIYHRERPDPQDAAQRRSVGCFEQVVALCEMAGSGGVVAQDEPFTATFTHSACTPVGGFQGIELFGTQGSIRYTFFRHTVELARSDTDDGAFRQVPLQNDDKREWTVERDFVDAVRSGNLWPEPSFRSGLRYMRFVDAVARSAREGRPVDVAEV